MTGSAEQTTIDPALEDALQALARQDKVLIASDFDGTLAEIVENPLDARPVPGAKDAMAHIATLPGVTALLISGRALGVLRELSGAPEGVHLVGSHGGEFDASFPGSPEPEAADEDTRARVLDALNDIASGKPGVAVEEKPLGIAIHYRKASNEHGQEAARAAEHLAEATPGVHAKSGKCVVEIVLVETDKGRALSAAREAAGASAALFLGDDVTDEQGFEALTGELDVTVKVGEGDTKARFRIDAPSDVVSVLRRFAQLRSG